MFSIVNKIRIADKNEIDTDGYGIIPSSNRNLNVEYSIVLCLIKLMNGILTFSIPGSSTLSQLNIWNYNVANFSQILSMTSKCSNNISGEILNWKNFEKILNYGTFKQMPSECDGK